MDDNKQQFQIYLPGLLKVLAESLYSSKKVAIRELLQNAHDSSVRRRTEYREASYRPRIDVYVDPEERTVTIQDNGSGLTKQEVGEYLSTIGRSYTRQLGEKLAVLSPEEAGELIGQFGLGFLSAFLVASEVRLITRSVKEGSSTLEWRSTGDVHYNVREIGEHPVGTTVTLQIKSGASFMLNEQILTDAVRQYADFLPVPIYVGNSVMAVNTMTPPWESINTENAIREYIERKYRMMAPLAIIELRDYDVDLGHDSMTVPMQGFLFIPPASVASIHEYGDMTVYIRRMFICDDQRNVLPSWARFVRGMIDCPYLQPTASREEIHQGDTFLFVQQAVEEQLVTGLKRIAETDPTKWKQIVRGHADVIMGWVVQNDSFFTQVADIVTFRTSRGQMNLKDYLEETGGKIYFVTRELGSLQEQLLGEGYGVPVLDASRFAVTPFLKKYAATHTDTELVQLDGESNQLLHAVPEDDFSDLLDYFRKRGIKSRVVTFKPEDVPAIVIYPKDAEFIVDTRKALDAGEVPGPLAGLVGDYVNRLSAADDDLEGTLYLNASSSLIIALTHLTDEALRAAALGLIYQMARLFSGRMLDTHQITQAFQESAKSIEKMIENSASET